MTIIQVANAIARRLSDTRKTPERMWLNPIDVAEFQRDQLAQPGIRAWFDGTAREPDYCGNFCGVDIYQTDDVPVGGHRFE